MPKVNIYEEDLTNSNASGKNLYELFIIGSRETGTTDSLKLWYNADKFKNEIGDGSKAAQTAIEALKNGIHVWYLDLVSNDNTTNIKDAVNDFANRGKYPNLRFLAAGDYSENIDLTNPQVYLAEIAAQRGDAIALIDAIALDYESQIATASSIDAAVTALTLGEVTRADGRKEFVSKYAAAFAPYVDIEEYQKLPGYAAYLCAFGASVNNYPDWFAASGSARGKVANIKGLSINFSDAEIDLLESRSISTGTHRATNAIAEINPFGKIVWGNRTLFQLVAEEGDGEGKEELVASSFLNIRHLCCDIKKVTFQESRKYTFDPNSDILWVNWKSEIVKLLEKMKSNQGIRGYKIQKLVGPKATLKAKIIIIPIEAVEDFDITVDLVDSIVSE